MFCIIYYVVNACLEQIRQNNQISSRCPRLSFQLRGAVQIQFPLKDMSLYAFRRLFSQISAGPLTEYLIAAGAIWPRPLNASPDVI
jgi:hypothetical protein